MDANDAARLRCEIDVSVAGAHIGVAIASAARNGPVTVVSIDAADLRRVAGATAVDVVTL